MNDTSSRTNAVETAATFTAQVRDNHEGALWRTVGSSLLSTEDAAWGRLTNEMQQRGLYYSELAAHIADMEAGEELAAEDGTGFRILAPGQELNQ